MSAQGSGPALAYSFSEGTGATTADISGNGGTATLLNGTAWTSDGRYGSGLTFDGSDDRVEVPASAPLDLTTAFTVEAWIFPTTTLPYGTVLARSVGGGGESYRLMVCCGGTLQARATTAGGTTSLYGVSTIPANRWTHVAATWDGATLRTYLNGIPDNSASMSGTLVASSEPVRIGGGPGTNFTGRLDEIRVYHRALSPSEIAFDMYAAVDQSAAPDVALRAPAAGAAGVITTPVAAIFTKPMNAATLTTATFTLQGPGGAVVGAVNYDPGARRATFTPSEALAPLTDYTATIAGGTSGASASDGGTLAGDVTWTFRTAAPAATPGAAYGFSEGSGLTTTDASGNGSHGTLRNGPLWTAQGVFGNALVFDGSNDDVIVADSDAIDPSTEFTLEGWVYPTTTTPYGKIIDKEGVGQHAYALGVTNGARVTVHMATGPGTRTFLGDGLVPANQWTHVAATYDGSTLRLYINGIQDISYAVTGSVVNSPLPLWIGKGPWGEQFTGRLDELRIYRRALSAAEIVDDMYRPADDSTPLSVATHTPAPGAVGVMTTPIAAIFTKAMNAATLTASTVTLQGPGGAVAGAVSYDAETRKTTFTPSAALSPLTDYTATVAGGASGVAAADGSTLSTSVSWSFRTAADAATASAAYGLSESTGLTTADSSGNSNHGALANGPTWSTQGMFGSALVFDGSNDHVAVPDSDALDLSTAFTLEGWVYPTTSPAYGKVIDKEGIGQHVYALGVTNGARVTVHMATGPGTRTFLGHATVPTNQWTHIAATYDGAVLRLYINGVQDAYHSVTGTVVASPKKLWIGKGPWGEGFTGRLDELRIYRRALTAADIVADMNASISDSTSPAVAGVTPVAATRNVSLTTTLTATFNESLDPATVNTATFQLRDTRSVLVPGTVAYDAPTRTAVFTPAAPLLPTRTYTGTLLGGASGMKDLAGNPLATSHTWTFISTVEGLRIGAGSQHSIAVDDAGQVWTWGANSSGQRGTGLDGRVPGAVSSAVGVKSVAAGENHSVALKADGTLLAWGANSEGQLGIGSQTNQTSPATVPGLTGVIAVAAGRSHSVALKSDGTVWAWGAAGRVGDGQNIRQTSPVQVASLVDITAVSAGDEHSLALKADGTVWAWGSNAYGQAGDNTTTATHLTPVQTVNLPNAVAISAGDYHSLAIVGGDLSVRAWGWNGNGELGAQPSGTPVRSPVAATGLTDVRAIDAGVSRSLAAMLDRTTRAWGSSTLITGGYSATPVIPPGAPSSWQVAGGRYHSLAVTANGIVSAWGHSLNATVGQIGDGTTVNRASAVAISEPPYLWKVGTPIFSVPAGTYSSTQSVGISSATLGTTIRYTTDGADPTDTDTLVPVNGVVSVDQSMTLKAKAWKTGQPSSNVASADYVLEAAAPILSPGGGTFTSAQTVWMSTWTSGAEIRYTTDGSEPTAVSLLYSSPVPVNTETTLRARAFRAPMAPSQIVTRTYYFNYGTLQAPYVTPTSATFTSFVDVTMGAEAGVTIRYTTDGSEPSLTSPTSVTYTGPVRISSSRILKAKAFKVDYTPSPTRTVAYWVRVAPPVFNPPGGSYPPGTTITAVSPTPFARVHYTIDGREPTQSDPLFTPSTPLVIGNFTVKARAFLVGAEPSGEASATYGTTGTLSIGAVAAGSHHSIALRPDGTTWGWGLNSWDRRLGTLYCWSGHQWVGHNSTTTPIASEATGIKAISTAYVSTAAVRADGRVVTWGANDSDQLGHAQVSNNCNPIDLADLPTPREVSGLTGVTAIDGGLSFYAALKSDGTVWSWGLNTFGQLGDGTMTSSGTPVQTGTLTNVAMVSAGMNHALAVRSDGTVWGWGNNSNGQVGHSTNSTLTPVQVAGITNPISIEAGWQTSYAVLSDGSVWVWGTIPYGLPTSAVTHSWTPVRVTGLSGIKSIASGPNGAFAVGQDGRVWAWGANTYGLLGDPSVQGHRGTPGLVPGLPAIREVSTTGHHALAIAADGSVWSWGWNASGQIGDGTVENRFTAMQVMGPTTMAPVEIATSGTLDPGQDVVHYYHTDAIGSVRAITSASGGLVQRYDYKPFGEEWTDVTLDDKRRFGGKERDKETGLNYFGARYLLSVSARFTSVDPAMDSRKGTVDPQHWNRYAYAANNPLRYVDPDGRAIETPWDAANVVLGLSSLGTNIAAGNVLGAVLDVGGIAFDAAATVIPGLPGGAGTALRVARSVERIAEPIGSVRQAAGGLRSFTRSGFRENVTRLLGRPGIAAHAHHVIPLEFAGNKTLLQAGFKNLNDPRLGVWWSATDHLKNAASYASEWRRFLDGNPHATREQILKFAQDLTKKYE